MPTNEVPTWEDTEEIAPSWEETSEIGPAQTAAFGIQQSIDIPNRVMNTLINPAVGMSAEAGRLQSAQERAVNAMSPHQLLAQTRFAATPYAAEGMKHLPEMLGRVTEEVFQPLSEMGSDFMRRSGLNPASTPGVPNLNIPARVPQGFGTPVPLEIPSAILHKYFPQELAGFEEGLGKFFSGFTESGQALGLPFIQGRVAQGVFGAQSLSQLPEDVQALRQAQSPEEFGQALAGTAANLAIGVGATREALKGDPYARYLEEARKVHENVPPQPGQGPGQVPLQEGGPGVQPHEVFPQETQVLLNQGLENNKRLGLGSNLRVLPDFGAGDPQNRRVFRASPPKPDGTPGDIEMSRAAFDLFMEGLDPSKRAEGLQAALAEEGIHSTVTGEQAAAYANTLTAAERALGQRLYLGGHPASAAGLTPELLGHELLRQRMQRLLKMSPTEIAEAAGREKWTRASLEFIANLIRRVREAFGTEAATTGKQMTQDLLKKYQENINRAAEAIGEKPIFDKTELTIPAPKEPVGEPSIPKAAETQPGLFPTAEPPKPTPAQGELPMSFRRGEPSKAVSDFEEALSVPGSQFRRGNDLSKATGMGAESMADLNKLADLRDKYEAERKQLMQKAIAAPTPEEQARLIEQSLMTGQKSQLARESIETAANVGSWSKEMVPDLGERPLDWQKNPEVAQWLKERGQKLGIDIGDLEQAPATFRRKMPTPEEFESGSHDVFGKMAASTLQQLEKSPEARPKAPTFQKFSKEIQDKFGKMPKTAVQDLWNKAMWKILPEASGKTLEALREGARIKHRVGSKEIADPVKKGEVPSLEGLHGDDLQQAKEVQKGIAARERYRSQVISALAEKFMASSLKEARLDREVADPSEIAFGEDAKQPAYNEITPMERYNVKRLGDILTDDARTEGVNVSHTKRLTVLQDKKSGRVVMASTFRDPRRGAVVMDPVSPVKEHVPLERVLKDWRPIASVLLEDPVKNYRERFESLSDYQEKFGNDAKSREATEASFEAPATEDKPEEPKRPDDFYAKTPLTPAEGRSVVEAIFEETGSLEGPEDVKDMIQGVKFAKNKAAVSGIRKIAAYLDSQHPDWDLERLLNEIVNKIYEPHKTSESFEAYSKAVQGLGSPESSEVIGAGAQAAPEPTGREVTTLRSRGPTDIRPENVPPGSLAPRQPSPPVPTGTLTKATSVQEVPAMFRRAAASAHEEYAALQRNLRKGFASGELVNRISAAIDQADNWANNHARRIGRGIRIQSAKMPGNILAKVVKDWEQGDPERLAAANVFVFSGSVDPNGQFAPFQAQAEIQRFRQQVINGMAKGHVMATTGPLIKRALGRAWVKEGEKLLKELKFAEDNLYDMDLWKTAVASKIAMDEQIKLERAQGYDVTISPITCPTAMKLPCGTVIALWLASANQPRSLGSVTVRPAHSRTPMRPLRRGLTSTSPGTLPAW